MFLSLIKYLETACFTIKNDFCFLSGMYFHQNTSIILTVVSYVLRFFGELMDQMEHFTLSVGVITGSMATWYSRSRLIQYDLWFFAHFAKFVSCSF